MRRRIAQGLRLHFAPWRCARAISAFGAQKTYDIEVWLAGQERFRENLFLLQLRPTSRRGA